MAVSEVLRELPKGDNQLSSDPNVSVPAHVKAAADAAAALHEQFYPKNPAAPEAPAKDALPQPVAPEPPHTPVEPQPAPAPPAPEHPSTADANVSAEEWRHRFLSMQGRFQAATKTIGSMEEQMRQLGEELVRTQNMINQPQPPVTRHPGADHNKLITDEDRQNYGDELIDLARRAARETVIPELDQLRAENERLTQRVQHTGRRELFASLDASLPDWRTINQSMRFKTWLRLPNVYTGQVRGNMLKAAVDGAQAPLVLQIFRDFLAEAQATGQAPLTTQHEQQAPLAAPRTAAIDLETLAAPGRARPASGDMQMPADKPIYSRVMISKFYDDKRRGLYAGRNAEADAFEADLTAAQREGRIRG